MDKKTRKKVRAIEGAEGSIIEKQGTGNEVKPQGPAVDAASLFEILEKDDDLEDAPTPEDVSPPKTEPEQ